jgi:hypothetical protein
MIPRRKPRSSVQATEHRNHYSPTVFLLGLMTRQMEGLMLVMTGLMTVLLGVR